MNLENQCCRGQRWECLACGIEHEPMKWPGKPGEQYFEYKKNGSNKFWAIKITGDTAKTVQIRFGKIGTKGTIMDEVHPSRYAANMNWAKRVQQKVDEGYAEVMK